MGAKVKAIRVGRQRLLAFRVRSTDDVPDPDRARLPLKGAVSRVGAFLHFPLTLVPIFGTPAPEPA